MTDDDVEFDAAIIEQLRRVPAVDPQLREQHLAVALAELSSRRVAGGLRSTQRWFAVAAASVALAAGGFAAGASTGNESGNDTLASEGSATNSTDASMIVKGGAGGTTILAGQGSNVTVDANLSSPCDNISGLTLLARYQVGLEVRAAYVRLTPAPAIVIVNETGCSVLEEIDLP